MSETPIHDLDWESVPSPCFVVDTRLLRRNAEIMHGLTHRVPKLKVLLALKGFAMWSVFPEIRDYLDGCCASGPIEARLARDKMNKEVHTYAPAFSERDMAETLPYSDHIVLNSPAQVRRHLTTVRNAARDIDIALRINPEYAEVDVDLYNPCAPCSRLGSTRASIDEDPNILDELNGLHLHALCEQGVDTLINVIKALDERFGDLIRRVSWLNLGGGHWCTKADYDLDRLVCALNELTSRYPNLKHIYLEPGEAWAVDTGVLVAQVEDITHNGMDLAILDVSVTAHMPDVLEMPYRPTIHGGSDPGIMPHTYRLGGPTCLAGDVVGDWSFSDELAIGSKIIFADMTHYTMVKTTMFNGVRHPSIASWDGKQLTVHREFSYEDYRDRLS